MKAYDPVMGIERLTVSLPDDLASAIRAAADADREAVSTWVADAARRRLAAEGLREVIAAWEREHGTITEAELAEARRRLGW